MTAASIATLKSIGTFVAAFAAAVVLAAQCSKPRWLVGRVYLWLMNRTHSGLTSWGLQHVSIGRKDAILDIGCGGGRTIQSLALVAEEGSVCGIDHSADSVAASRNLNRELIAAGRGSIQQGSVSSLPFGDATFDLVTAVETHYYWPNPVADFREVLRVLKPGGRFLVIAEVHRRGKHDYMLPLVMRLLGGACPSAEELRDQLTAAGFSSVQSFEEKRKGWLASVASKPPQG